MRYFLLLLVITLSCNKPNNSINFKQLRGISFNEKIDNKEFEMCHEDLTIIYSPFDGIGYEGEKPAVVNEFKKKYLPVSDSNQNGYITIRFVVNCKGEAGRYRVIEMNEDYNEIKFDKRIVDQIVSITKSLNKWKISKYEGKGYDYNQYLTFKIKRGSIIEILP